VGRVRAAALVATIALGFEVTAPAPSDSSRRLDNLIILFAAVACVTGYLYVYGSGRARVPIRSDAFSYYVYLPAWLLYHDSSLQAVADDCCGGEFPAWTAIIRWPGTNRWVDAHPIGEAILIAPAFIAAHLLTRWTNLSADGFTIYYQHGAGLAGLSCAVAGLWFLRRVLRRHFSTGVTTATLATLLAGTSLYHYATFDSVWSHAFSFALFSAWLERLDVWSEDTHRGALALGVLSGLITLVRHPNVLLPLCFLTSVAVHSWRRGEAGWPGGRLAATALVVTGILLLPQLWLYRSATGHWLTSSYGDLGFNFSSPQIVGVLFSPRKGLFFWAPVLLLAVPGFFALPDRLKDWRLPIVVFLFVDTYLVASWWDWQFGASFGHRAFVDVYPLFALGLAAFYTRIAATTPAIRRSLAVLVLACCMLSVFQMLQYWNGVLPMSDITWTQYKSAFLRLW
jgi:hypothetical protein